MSIPQVWGGYAGVNPATLNFFGFASGGQGNGDNLLLAARLSTGTTSLALLFIIRHQFTDVGTYVSSERHMTILLNLTLESSPSTQTFSVLPANASGTLLFSCGRIAHCLGRTAGRVATFRGILTSAGSASFTIDPAFALVALEPSVQAVFLFKFKTHILFIDSISTNQEKQGLGLRLAQGRFAEATAG